MTDALLDIKDLSKDYQTLRPLRIRELRVRPGDVLSITGIDVPGAETFVHLVTGATLPDAGEVVLFGRNTREITDSDAWLKSLDGVGMITARGILIEAFSVLQNIALSLTLEVDPIDARVVPQAGALAREAGIDAGLFDMTVGRVAPDVKMRVHLARALALGPKMLIAEHPSASLLRETVSVFGADLGRAVRARGLALICLTADDVLAKTLAGSRLELVAATGELRALSRIRRLFR
ncbi:MAG TPA: ATP-binding cassette domain-containing protein [Vicinamibacterales bacterium]|nr:ATP-binding cassette domain-containing protein [Vicinamibacterales bacterium]